MNIRPILRLLSLVMATALLSHCATREPVTIKHGCTEARQWGDPCTRGEVGETTAGSMYHLMRNTLHVF